MDVTLTAARRVIDCDLHPTVTSIEMLFPYLSDYWREQISQSGFKGPVDSAYPASAVTSARPDVPAAHSGSVAEQLGALRAEVLGPGEVACGILNYIYAVDSLHNPDAAAARGALGAAAAVGLYPRARAPDAPAV